MNAQSAQRAPRLSIIAIFYNMAREAPRTLHTLSTAYQKGIAARDYEVIAIDNGSREPLDPVSTLQHGENFRHLRIDDALPSPAAAINRGVAESSGAYVGILIDGARMLSPGLLAMALECLERTAPSVVATVGFHLGPDTQSRSIAQGYNQQVEDDLLAGIDWRKNGYSLFDISALAGSSRTSWLDRIVESNLIFTSRDIWQQMGGYDERFDIPGGGLVNLDFYKRATELADVEQFTLLGEATFHQVHGGTMTNRQQKDVPQELKRYYEQYQAIRGHAYHYPERRAKLYGFARRETVPWLHRSAERLFRDWGLGPDGKAHASGKPAPPPVENLKPGDEHYRAYVGRVEHYDLAAGTQFSLLFMLGLRETHRLLDIGCGSLRGGRLFIPFLQPGNYFGLEPNRWLVEQGIREELGEEVARKRQPRFTHNDRFDLSDFRDIRFDFVLAQSILSHTGMSQLRDCLRAAASALTDDGVLVSTFVEWPHDEYEDRWVYPGLNRYTWATIRAECAAVGLHCVKLDWPHTLQTWFLATRDICVVQGQRRSAVDFLPDDVVLTGARFRGRKEGKGLRFLRHLRD